MKHIFVNLKRFDISPDIGGVNRIAPYRDWAGYIIRNIQDGAGQYDSGTEFAVFFPEAHLLSAVGARAEDSNISVGCQSVYRGDTSVGGNFGAFTASLTANAARAAGCSYALIGHCEERKDKCEIILAGGGSSLKAVDTILNQEIKQAVKAGLKVLYCIGEKAGEQDNWQEVLKTQLEDGLDGVDKNQVVVAYEPVWAIGPGKVPPGEEYIRKIAVYVKEITGGMDVVYGGGLKKENAAMLAGIPEIDGGLIALTRFQGDIGFYPEEFLEIVRLYHNH